MHAEALPPLPRSSGEGWTRPVLLALAVHVLVALVFTLAWLWSPTRSVEAAAGDMTMEASLAVSTAEASMARRALRESEKLPTLPEPVVEPEPVPVEEDTIPPPQPLPEPRPQDASTPQQHNAQERIAEPDTVDQERVSALAVSQEKARQEQEAKRRQEQIDLTERKRVEEAEQKLRLARQQEEADRQKKLAEEQRLANEAKAEQEKAKRLAELRARREQAEKEAQQAEQKLRQVADARARQAAAASAASSGSTQATPGQGGNSDDLAARYAAAIQQAVLNQWVRPDSVPLGQRCRLTIRQLPGGEVVEVQVAAGCPYDEAGRRSIEAAVLRAQPLPFRGFESVFQRTLNFNFEAQDR
ncbi:cell envelope integrity protein TolA [Flavobacterium sp. MXW15]|uniref:Cell envelope integrity protein TolA n=1 Tax=Xanthomonas chitinilytica TaxID=2989819 RepID=A0ABT3JZL1_9XANT|nr:cell envelope integrity protein TolA [Xanthomonas sp. H13-6]MCW4456187.1 cell envelope integrity protein TolA [Flavobacterium sp. MXW15]MCW4473928.1 cell envelope integrity protein TolA [Xanthomonas sp. H13-6]